MKSCTLSYIQWGNFIKSFVRINLIILRSKHTFRRDNVTFQRGLLNIRSLAKFIVFEEDESRQCNVI